MEGETLVAYDLDSSILGGSETSRSLHMHRVSERVPRCTQPSLSARPSTKSTGEYEVRGAVPVPEYLPRCLGA